jgi:hypothetical protein
MLATMQRMLGKLAPGRGAPDQAGTIAKLAGRLRGQAWAQSLQQLLDCANRSTSAAQFPHPEWEAPLLLRTNVVQAFRAELLEIKDALLDMRQPSSDVAVQQLKTFLADPSASAVFGSDPIIARRAAKQLLQGFTGNPDA